VVGALLKEVFADEIHAIGFFAPGVCKSMNPDGLCHKATSLLAFRLA
jgi:hypothetical protein